VIPNPFRDGCQHYWVRRCLVDYPCLPNVCNLDTHVRREGTGQVWPDGRGGGREEDLLYKLRWTTLGYHYDWNTKQYYEDRKSPFPLHLAQLSTFILRVAGFPGYVDSTCSYESIGVSVSFLAEAGIVNYYHLDSTLSGHTDHSERDLSRPLLSISFGQSAVFLVGGETKSVLPQAIILRSGDVVIMSGASRLAYHGVPKIISPPPTTPVPPALSRVSLLDYLHSSGGTLQPCRLASSGPLCCVCQRKEETPAVSDSDSQVEIPPTTTKRLKIREEGGERSGMEGWCQQWSDILREWAEFERYISTSRINVNIRQVNTCVDHNQTTE
jgi:DNA alkylation damage repair protein AlkB